MKGRRARPTRPAESGADLADDLKFTDNMDAEKYKEALGNMSPEEVQKASKAVDELLDSNFIEEYFSDEAKLEQARLDMLKNLDKYDQAMPGFKEQAREIASDPVKWKNAMETAKNQMLQLKKQRDDIRAKQGGSAPQQPPAAEDDDE